jgi:YbgC/YbaW family acyl-CoA thioester hydrolase
MSDPLTGGERVAHVTHLRVRFGETDAAGIVFYPNLFTYFDVAAQELFRACGFAVAERMREEGAALPIVESGARFHLPLLHDDEIAVHTAVAHVGTKSMRLEHRVERGGRVCCEGFEVRVFGRRAAGGVVPEPIPAALREALVARRGLGA